MAKAREISIHTPRVGRDLRQSASARFPTHFNPHAPCGARRVCCQRRQPKPAISIHTPRVGRDAVIWRMSLGNADFNPHAPCGARPPLQRDAWRRGDFNPHAPCGARQCTAARILHAVARFQSTRPVWGATDAHAGTGACGTDFNPHAPCGARPMLLYGWLLMTNFNPHAPCGARHPSTAFPSYGWRFQSTRPVWGATPILKGRPVSNEISIHTPRVGRDYAEAVQRIKRGNFNPHAPCGARQRGIADCTAVQ